MSLSKSSRRGRTTRRRSAPRMTKSSSLHSAMKLLAFASLPGAALAGCTNDCSLNGVCDTGTSQCVCDEGWTHDDCSRLDLLPAPSACSFHGQDSCTATGNVTSSWGGNALRLPTASSDGGEQWVLFAAEMTHRCTLRHWTTNSEVVLATAQIESPTGPYKEEFQIIAPWSHNPEAIRTADDEIVVFTLGNGIPIHGPEYICDGKPNPPAPPIPPLPPTPSASDKVHDVTFLTHHAPATGGAYMQQSAWKAHNTTIKNMPVAFHFQGNWNPAPVALPDGRVRVMVHTGYSGYYNTSNGTIAGWSGEVVIEAPSWKGPYEIITSRDITNCTHCQEDPFMWIDKRKNWHVLYHRMFDNGTDCNGYPSFHPDGKLPSNPCKSPEGLWSMGHSYSKDGIVWSPIVRAANTTAQLADGTSVTFTSRERPKLIMAADGSPGWLSNAVQPFQAGAGADAGVTHTLVVPLNTKKNRERLAASRKK